MPNETRRRGKKLFKDLSSQLIINRFILFFQGVAEVTGAYPSYLSGRRQGTLWTSRQLIAGPLLMAEAATQGTNCTSGAILGFSILLKYATRSSVPPQGSQDSNKQPSNH